MTLPSAGWYPDPENPTHSRWWDGLHWSEQSSGFQAAPAPAPYSSAPAALSAPAGTPWNTPWIWILVFLPYVSSLGLFFIDFSSMFDLSNPSGMIAAEMAMITSPGYLFMLLGSWASYALFVWFSYLDWRTLRDRGVPQPFHWAWGFLTLVYTIGRSVVVRRRTGKGISPMWVTIVTYVVAVIGTSFYTVYLMSTIFSTVMTTYPGTLTP